MNLKTGMAFHSPIMTDTSPVTIIMLSDFLNFRQYVQDHPTEFSFSNGDLFHPGPEVPPTQKQYRYKTFNARAESISSKPSFSGSFKSKRCLIPVKGFFEWQHAGNEKIPWYIYHADEEIFSFAGLFDQWVETSTGETFNTFSIITTDANDLTLL